MKYIMLLLISISAYAAENPDLKDEPKISIYQGTEKGTSVVVLQWPNGKIERLVYKNENKDGVMQWFKDRMQSYENR